MMRMIMMARGRVDLVLVAMVLWLAPGALPDVAERVGPPPPEPGGLGVAGKWTGDPKCPTTWWPGALEGRLAVRELSPGGTAEHAGIRPDDILVEVAEAPGHAPLPATREGLATFRGRAYAGQEVEVVIFRAVPLPPPEARATSLGLRLEPLSNGHGRSPFFGGACLGIVGVEGGGPAKAAGLRPGDLLTGAWAGGDEMALLKQPKDLSTILARAEPEGKVGVVFRRSVKLLPWPPNTRLSVVAADRIAAGDPAGALLLAGRGLQTAPDDSAREKCRLVLIDALCATGRAEEALAHAEAGLAQATGRARPAQFLSKLVGSYIAAGRPQEGVQRLLPLVPAAEDGGEILEYVVHNGMARLHCAAGDHQAAIQFCHERLEDLPSDDVRRRPRMWSRIAREQSHLSRYDDALESLSRALKLASQNTQLAAQAYDASLRAMRATLAGQPELRAAAYLKLWQQADYDAMHKAWAPEAKGHRTRAQFVRELEQAAAAGTALVDSRNPQPLWEELGEALVVTKKLEFSKDLPPNFVTGGHEFHLVRDEEGIWRIAAITRPAAKPGPLVIAHGEGPARLPPRASSAFAEEARYQAARHVWKGEFEEAALFLQTQFEVAEDEQAEGEMLMLQAWVEFRAGDKGAAAALLDRVVKDYPALKARAEAVREAWERGGSGCGCGSAPQPQLGGGCGSARRPQQGGCGSPKPSAKTESSTSGGCCGSSAKKP